MLSIDLNPSEPVIYAALVDIKGAVCSGYQRVFPGQRLVLKATRAGICCIALHDGEMGLFDLVTGRFPMARGDTVNAAVRSSFNR